ASTRQLTVSSQLAHCGGSLGATILAAGHTTRGSRNGTSRSTTTASVLVAVAAQQVQQDLLVRLRQARHEPGEHAAAVRLAVEHLAHLPGGEAGLVVDRAIGERTAL